MTTSSSFATRPGFQIASRVLAAVFGGYALASAVAVLLAATLPTTRQEAVVAGMQWSFVVHVAAAIWAFSPVRLSRVWSVLVIAVVASLGAAWVFGRTAVGG